MVDVRRKDGVGVGKLGLGFGVGVERKKRTDKLKDHTS